MKDKIFVTFLCATLCVVTNAMGAVGDGPGTCVVQDVPEREMPGNVVEYNLDNGRSVRIYDEDVEYVFIADDEALLCGDDYCGHGVEIKMSGKDFVLRCIVNGRIAGWNQWAIPFCEESKVKQLDVDNAEYIIDHKGQGGEIFDGDGYAIDTKGFCWNSDCKAGYNVVVNNGENGQTTYKCEAQTGGKANKPTDNGGDGAEIEQLGKWLDDETEKFERSKWRDAEGKFNTARLASDSIAAVVLGTAGGLISSKVIKKKQVENGFEDIKCTIGSQEVADWGDEFQVGIQ